MSYPNSQMPATSLQKSSRRAACRLLFMLLPIFICVPGFAQNDTKASADDGAVTSTSASATSQPKKHKTKKSQDRPAEPELLSKIKPNSLSASATIDAQTKPREPDLIGMQVIPVKPTPLDCGLSANAEAELITDRDKATQIATSNGLADFLKANTPKNCKRKELNFFKTFLKNIREASR